MTTPLVLEQFVRCYLDPLPAIDETQKRKKEAREKNRKEHGTQPSKSRDQFCEDFDFLDGEWCGPSLVFDTETHRSPESGQKCRFGFYQDRGCSISERVDIVCRIMAGTKSGRLSPKLLEDRKREAWGRLDRLYQEGVFYDEAQVTPDEIDVIKAFAAKNDIACITLQEFVVKKIYSRYWLKGKDRTGDELHKCIIGLNLPFDFGAISTHTSASRDINLYGSLSLELNTGYKPTPAFPRIKIKKIGFGKHFFGFNSRKKPVGDPEKDADFSETVDGKKVRRFHKTGIHVLDCMTIGRALVGRGDLSGLGKALNTKTRKLDFDPNGPVTDEFLTYARTDVQATWEIYVELRKKYAAYGLNKRMWSIYSGASLGKAHMEMLKIPEFFTRSRVDGAGNWLKDPGVFDCPGFDKKYLGYAAECFYGGRSEIRVRLQERMAMLLDFKSEYPTVNALMDLQQLLLAENVSCVENDANTLAFLETVQLDDLQKKEIWPLLRGFALVKPCGDVLPFRANYANDAVNIGVNLIQEGPPAWYCFADIIASKLATGKLPEIIRSVTLVPSEARRTATPFNICGNPDYRVDPNTQDIFTAVINLRTKMKDRIREIKREIDRLTAGGETAAQSLLSEKLRLEGEEGVVKELANGTSYGIHVESNINEQPGLRKCHVFFGDGDKEIHVRTKHRTLDGEIILDPTCIEAPGEFYSPYGGLIPAAGRLLLMIAEKLGKARGLSYIFCDTDSMCFCPDGENIMMSHGEFTNRVKEISDWFQPLNPYEGEDRIFKLEDVNHRLKDGTSGKHTAEFEPLYGIGISAKRYCLYNLRDGKPIIRKLTAHGLGALEMPPEYRAACPEPYEATHIAAPLKESDDGTKFRDYKAIAHCNEARFALDAWLIAIKHVRTGTPSMLDDINRDLGNMPAVRLPAMCQRTLATLDDYQTYSKIGGFRAFQFFNTLGGPIGPKEAPLYQNMAHARADIRRELLATSFYCGGAVGAKRWKTPRTNDEWLAIGLKRRDTGEFPAEIFDPSYDLRFKTPLDMVPGYFNHAEAKSFPPNGVGELSRQPVIASRKVWVGKETNPLIGALADENADFDENDFEAHPAHKVLIGGARRKSIPDDDLQKRLNAYGRFDEVLAAMPTAGFTIEDLNEYAISGKLTAEELTAASAKKELHRKRNFEAYLKAALNTVTKRDERREQQRVWDETKKAKDLAKAAEEKAAFKRQRFLAVIAQDYRCSCVDIGYNPERTFRGFLKARAGFAARLEQIAIDRRLPDGTNEPALDQALLKQALEDLAAQCGLAIPKFETAPRQAELYYGGVSERDVGGRTLTMPAKTSWVEEIATGGARKDWKDGTRPEKRGTGDEKRLATWSEFVTEEGRRFEEKQAHEREAERLKKQRQRAEREAEEARRAAMTPEEKAAEKAERDKQHARMIEKLGFGQVKTVR